jgi:ribulose-bisphosphate carboxylase large chain
MGHQFHHLSGTFDINFLLLIIKGKIGMLKEYIDIGYIPDETDFVCEYSLEPAPGVSFEKACNHLAEECSIGTWKYISLLSPKIANRLKPHIFYMDEKKQTVRVSYPQDLFEFCSIPQIISTVAYNILNNKIIHRIKLYDMTLPSAPMSEFWGPKYGIEGIREIIGVTTRPLVSATVKPKVGLDSATHAKIAYNYLTGGCDLVKDDENLTDQKFNRFEKRAQLAFKYKDKAEEETGERKLYICNITAPTCEEMIRRANFISNIGGNYVMVDAATAGWSSLQTLRDVTEELELAIHAHSMIHSVCNISHEDVISRYLVTKLARLVGFDQFFIDVTDEKILEDKKELMSLRDCCIMDKVNPNDNMHILFQNWDGIKPMFPFISSESGIPLMSEVMNIFGNDAVIEFSNNICSHPMGTISGAKACRQVIDAMIAGISLEEYAKTHEELEAFLNNGV